MKYGLVLAGGGARGAYQIGVMKALKELNIEISAVCGTSIGAINGAMFVQGGFETAGKMWHRIRLKDIVKLPGDLGDNLLSISNLPELIKGMHSGGFDVSPLEKLLKRLIDEDKLRSSPMDFGLISISLTNHKTVRIFKEDIPRGKIYEYLIAGASLPVFKAKEIDGEKFIDGGAVDNMPMDMLIDRGVTDIIAVDVHGIGVKRDICSAGINVIEISCSKPEIGTMEFKKDGIEKSINTGYYDSMKVFGRYSGSKFFFDTAEYTALKKIYGSKLLSGIEQAADIFGLDNLRMYRFDEFVKKTLALYRKCAKKYDGAALAAIHSEGAAAVVVQLINMLKEKNSGFIKKKLDIFGKYYDAAGALIYFERKFK